MHPVSPLGVPRGPFEVLLEWGGDRRRITLEGRYLIGRDPTSDLALSDPLLSRQHCRLEPHREGVKITDLGSRNGTWVGGREISQVILRPGDVAELGRGAVRIEIQIRQEASASGPPKTVAVPTADVGPRLAQPARGSGSSLASRNGRRAKPWILGVLGVLLVVAVFLATRGTAEEDAALALARARAHEASGDLRAAVGELHRVNSRWPETQAGRAAVEGLVRVEALLEERESALRALDEVLLARDFGTLEEVEAALRALRARYPEAVVSDEEFGQRLAEARGRAEQRAEELLAEVRSAVQAFLGGSSYGLALARVEDIALSPFLLGEPRSQLQDLRVRVLREAGRAHERLVLGAAEAAPDAALSSLRTALADFTGTPYEGDLRARCALLEAEVARRRTAAPRSPVGLAVSPAPAPPPPEVLRVLAEAEDLASRRRYAAALPALEKAQALVPLEDRAPLVARAGRLKLLGEALEAIVEAVRQEPGRFRSLEVGGELRGDVIHADREGLELSLGPRARLRWDWARLSGERLERLLVRTGVKGNAWLGGATLLLDAGHREGALRLLGDRFELELGLRPEAEALVAAARELVDVPKGGFHLFGGRLLTLAEKQTAERQARMAALSDQVARGEPGAWNKAAAELREVVPGGGEAVVLALGRRLEWLGSQAAALSWLRGREVAALRQQLFQELSKRREAALSLIFDTQRYPYPYGPDQAQVQAEVDQLVAQVSRIWESPALELLDRRPDLQALYQDATAVRAMLLEVATDVADEEGVLKPVNEALSLAQHPGDQAEERRLDHWRRVEAYNQFLGDVMSDPERECLQATNQYRVMMGLRALMADERLVRCARGHSEEMHTQGYFSHTSPVSGRETPSDRARQAGWGGGVSENIAQGAPTGRDAFLGWRHSSGHHRNLLGRRWTHLGVGRAPQAPLWTQNFGSANAEPPEVPRRPAGAKEAAGEGAEDR